MQGEETTLPGNMQHYLPTEMTVYGGKRAFSNPVLPIEAGGQKFNVHLIRH